MAVIGSTLFNYVGENGPNEVVRKIMKSVRDEGFPFKEIFFIDRSSNDSFRGIDSELFILGH